MGYLDGITASYLRKNDRGELRYYPYGIWGKAYKVETDQQAKSIKLKHNFLYIFCAAIVIIIITMNSIFNTEKILFYSISLLGLPIVYTIFYISTIRIATRQLTPSNEKPTWAEQFSVVATHFGAGTLGALVALQVIFIAVGIFVLSTGDRVLGWLLIGIGVPCLFALTFQLRAALRAKKRNQ